ncbi:Mitochondrial import inner membrane translocase subunit tim16, partial [Globisporangium splendens]
MSGPLGRIIAQVVVMSAGIVSRAFVQAYQQAVHNAKTGNTSHLTAKAVVKKNAMSREQALEILNFPTSAKPKPDEISKQFKRYFEANDPAKGGSFYLQSKIYRAKEALEHEEAEQQAAAENPEKPQQ